MSLKVHIDQDLKQAMLTGDKEKVSTLRGLKSVILNAEIANNKRNEGLDEKELMIVLQKESKKRQESADLYRQGGNNERAEAELAEKVIIEAYLPEQLTEEDIAKVVDRIMAKDGTGGPQVMGQVIG